jgi:hypothetical protein
MSVLSTPPARRREGRKTGALADRMSATRRQSSEEFTLPVDAARNKAREIINQSAPSRLIPIVENWRQLPDGQIKFTVRCLPAAD